jgi:hypothetical protein
MGFGFSDWIDVERLGVKRSLDSLREASREAAQDREKLEENLGEIDRCLAVRYFTVGDSQPSLTHN